MNPDDIIRMAREAWVLPDAHIPNVLEFAHLVAAAEREACAKVCEELRDEDGYEAWNTECAAAIRARGQHVPLT